MISCINGRPKKMADKPRKKKRIIFKPKPVNYFGTSYMDVTNIFSYSSELESDMEYERMKAFVINKGNL